MSHENMEIRVALLEQDARERRKALDDMVQSHREFLETIHKMDKKLDQVLERPQCPAVGLCKELEPKVEALLTTQAENAGGKKMLAGLLAAAGVAGGAVSWVLSHLSKHP